MTTTGQNFGLYQGDTKDIIVALDMTENPSLDISTCTFDWAVYKQTTKEIVMHKTTASGIVADNVLNEITISILRDETNALQGRYLHICKMIDINGYEYTPFTGYVDVYESVI